MSAMEKSLRRALDAGDASNPAFRDTIYTAAERALERMLESSTDEEAAHAQRVRLAETINLIEEDYFVAEPVDEAEASEAVAERDAAEDLTASDEHFDETASSRDALDEADAENYRDLPAAGPDHDRADAEPLPVRDATEAEAETWSPGGTRRAAFGDTGRRVSKPLLIALAVVLVVLFAGLYLLKTTVLGQAETTADATSTPAETAEWINLFDGTQLELISTPSGGDVKAITGGGDRPAVRLASANEGSELGITVGPGIVNTIKGRKVRVEITAGSSDGASREFSVRCLFGGDTVCDRQRFTTLQTSEPFVFDMDVPADPAASGSIVIDPSFGVAKNDIDLYTVRLRDLGKA